MKHRTAALDSINFIDRRRRLTLFGLMSIAVGAAAMLFGLLNLLLPLLSKWVPDAPTQWRPAIAGAMTYGLIGCAFLWAGIGSVRHRRWVRSFMLVLSWTWLLSGAIVVPMMALLLGDMIAVSAQGPDAISSDAIGLLTILFVGVSGLFGIAMPAVFIWVYRDPNLDQTCQAYDPNPSLTDRCPPAIMQLSLALAVAAIVSVPMALQPIVPVFGFLWVGVPAALVILLCAAACGWLARSVYFQQRWAWWGTLFFLTGIGVSTTLTLARVESKDWFLAMDYPDEMMTMIPQGASKFGIWISVVITVATVIYLATIRHHFERQDSTN